MQIAKSIFSCQAAMHRNTFQKSTSEINKLLQEFDEV